MKWIDSSGVHSALPYQALVERLRAAFQQNVEVPERHHHELRCKSSQDGILLLMPARRAGAAMGVKIVSVFPDNPKRDLPAVSGVYVLLEADNGRLLGLLDATSLTLRRTAAASALAASFLARPDSSRLLMVGAGALAPHLVRAHAELLPIRSVTVWNRHPEKAAGLAQQLGAEGLDVKASRELEGPARSADLISCATPSTEPLIRGEWLRPGVHLDLVGGFTPEMREVDDEAVLRSRIFVDTRGGALQEAGDLLDPISREVIGPERIEADLFDLCRGKHPGRGSSDDITLFKSVGTALEDLAAAEMVVEKWRGLPGCAPD